MVHCISGSMYRIDRIKRNLKYLRSLTGIISQDNEKLSKNYVLDCYTHKLKEMEDDIEELDKFVTFIKAIKK